MHPLGRTTTNQPGSRNSSQNQLIWQFTHLAHGNTTGPGAVHRVDPQTPDEQQPTRQRSRHRQPPTRPATGNRPSPGAAPTRTISAESTAPWTRRIAEQPTSTAESWRCSPTHRQQRAHLDQRKLCPDDPGCSGNRLTCRRSAEAPSTADADGCHIGRWRIHRREIVGAVPRLSPHHR